MRITFTNSHCAHGVQVIAVLELATLILYYRRLIWFNSCIMFSCVSHFLSSVAICTWKILETSRCFEQTPPKTILVSVINFNRVQKFRTPLKSVHSYMLKNNPRYSCLTPADELNFSSDMMAAPCSPVSAVFGTDPMDVLPWPWHKEADGQAGRRREDSIPWGQQALTVTAEMDRNGPLVCLDIFLESQYMHLSNQLRTQCFPWGAYALVTWYSDLPVGLLTALRLQKPGICHIPGLLNQHFFCSMRRSDTTNS